MVLFGFLCFTFLCEMGELRIFVASPCAPSFFENYSSSFASDSPPHPSRLRVLGRKEVRRSCPPRRKCTHEPRICALLCMTACPLRTEAQLTWVGWERG